jgi:hypothetical protein
MSVTQTSNLVLYKYFLMESQIYCYEKVIFNQAEGRGFAGAG